MKKKKNAKDLTLRNARASKKRDDKFVLELVDIKARLAKIEKTLVLVLG